MRHHSLQGIQEFLRVVQEGSFTGAAEALGTSRSRISQVVAALESSLGVQLIRRSTRTMHLTEAGEAFYRECEQGFRLIHQAIDQAQEDQQQLTGTVRINSVGGKLGEQILAPLLLEFMAQHPEVRIELDFTSAHVDLIGEHYDLAVRMGKLPDSTLIARPWKQYRTFVVASPAFVERYGLPAHPRELNHYPVANGSLGKWRFTQRSQPDNSVEVAVRCQLQAANGHVTRLAALAGNAIACKPAFYVEEDLANGTLVEVFEDWERSPSIASLVYPQSRFRLQRVQALVNFLLER